MIRRYDRAWLAGDVVAGVTTAAVVIPQAMAYASLAGLPVQFGLYVAFVPMLVYAVLGGSRALSVSTTSTVAILTATAISGCNSDCAARSATLALLVGVLLGGAGLLKLGFLADFISLPFVESTSAGRAFVRKGDPRLDADQELRALGGSNLLGSVFQAFPASGGLSQTAVNDGAGARSSLAGGVTGVFAALTLLFLTGLFANLAEATLGAVVLVAILGLLDTSTLRRIARISRRDAMLGLVAVVGVLLVGVLDGVLIAVVASLVALMYGINHMPIRVLGRDPTTGVFEDVHLHEEAEPISGVLILRPEGGLYFANAGPASTSASRGGCSGRSPTPQTSAPPSSATRRPKRISAGCEASLPATRASPSWKELAPASRSRGANDISSLV